MRAITFLGAGTAYETTYTMPNGQESTANYFGAALAKVFPDLQMSVLVTTKAKEMHLTAFQEQTLPYIAELDVVDIPDGIDESQLWEIFERVVNVPERGEQVIFDITHGFRSLPFLAFLAAAYLRVVKSVQLEAVLYGALEAGDRSVTPSRAPVFELTPFIDLLDWMTAADRFLRFGDSSDLADRLAATKPDYRTASKTDLAEWKNSGIGSANRVLSEISNSLRLIRPFDAMSASEQLRETLPNVIPQIGQYARPFASLSHHIISGYAPLAMSSERIESDPYSALIVERELIHWFLQRKQLVQAVAVAREWLVSWGMLQIGMSDVLDKDLRERVEHTFGYEIQRGQGKVDKNAQNPFYTDLLEVNSFTQALNLYTELGDLRNDLLHAGKRKGAKSAHTLTKLIDRLCKSIDELSLPTPNTIESSQ
jgi:CRISPR-associated DxTHG motif protein